MSLSDLIRQYPWDVCRWAIVPSKPLFSAAATVVIFMPLGLTLGMQTSHLVAFYVAADRVFFLPTYGALLAAISYNQTGTTKGEVTMFSGITVTFLKEFGEGFWIALPLLLSLAIVIILIGQWVGRKEGWSKFDSFYWAFVTATTVGYGDVRPTKTGSKIAAILIAGFGLMLTGILIALAVRAATIAMQARAGS